MAVHVWQQLHVVARLGGTETPALGKVEQLEQDIAACQSLSNATLLLVKLQVVKQPIILLGHVNGKVHGVLLAINIMTEDVGEALVLVAALG
jgi:hypothetical protein